MIESEMAFCDLAGNTELAEDFLKHVFRAVLRDCPEDMEFFNQRIDPTVLETLAHIVDSPFEHLSYGEAIAVLEKSGRDFEFPVKWGAALQAEHERYLCEEHVGRPVVVTDYPTAIKPFYMYVNDDGRTVRAMDVLVAKIGEICGGSQREHRLDVLDRRLAECGVSQDEYWWYRDLRRYSRAARGSGAPHPRREPLRAPHRCWPCWDCRSRSWSARQPGWDGRSRRAPRRWRPRCRQGRCRRRARRRASRMRGSGLGRPR